MGAKANLLVGVEAHAHTSVFDFGVIDKVVHGLYNLGYAGLVVGTEQGVAVGYDDVLSYMVEQFGEFGGRGYDTGLGIEHNVTAIVGLDNAGLDVGP